MVTRAGQGLVNRTVSRFRRLVRRASVDGFDAHLDEIDAELSPDASVLLERLIDACLSGQGGDGFSRSRSAQIAEAYSRFDETGRLRFFELLDHRYGVESGGIDSAIAAWTAADDEPNRRLAERGLRSALISPWTRLIHQFAGLPDGVKFVVDLRGDLLALRDANPHLVDLDRQLRDILAGWFDVGFIDLEEIRWDRTSAVVLERLIAYEAVHEISSWDDLRNRLGPDRRLYAYFHPRMPSEPLIFVEVALVSGMADNLDHLLDQHAPDEDAGQADTAVFYSISACQEGLAGVSFGDFLIKRAVTRLSRELPNLEYFVTLSPISGFRSWLTDTIDQPHEGSLATALAQAGERATLVTGASGPAALTALVEHPELVFEHEAATALREPLLSLAAQYLVNERSGTRALDRVARFHLSNGARVERINWTANSLPAGIERSFGMMVNYRYDVRHIEANQRAYHDRHQVVAAPAVLQLLAD